MNENYYVINATILKENDTPSQSIFFYSDLNNAKSVYHQTVASNYASDTIKFFNTIIINNKNLIMASEYADLS